MGNIRRAFAVSALAAAGALAVLPASSAHAASHARTYRSYLVGAASTQAACDSNSASHNDPPDVITGGCLYYVVPPPGWIGKGGTGWYYIEDVDID